MSRRPLIRILFAGLTAASLAVAPLGLVAGQDASCPVAYTCVAYDDTTIAIDPAQGPVQAIVVQEQTVTTVTFGGTAETRRATLAVYLSNGDTFAYARDVTVEQAGAFAGASLGDVYQLTEAASAD